MSFCGPGEWEGSVSMVHCHYRPDLEEVQGDEAIARLLDAPASAPFDRLAWWQGLARECGIEPLLAIAGDDAGRIAILPLARDNGGLCALANYYSFRTRPVITPGADRATLLTALASDLATRATRIVLAGVPDEDGSASALSAAFRAAGWVVFSEICDTNHVLPVNGRSFAHYLAGRPGPLRTTLKRKAGKVDITLHTAFSPAAWADYEAVYRLSWKPGEGFMPFLQGFAREEGAAGRLRLGIAHAVVDGIRQPVAAQLWTVEGGTAFIHKLAHVEAASGLSPGTSLSAALFEQVIDRDRVDLVDFGTGDDPYKRAWMEQQRPRYRLTLLRPGAPRQWPLIVRSSIKRLARAFRRS